MLSPTSEHVLFRACGVVSESPWTGSPLRCSRGGDPRRRSGRRTKPFLPCRRPESRRPSRRNEWTFEVKSSNSPDCRRFYVSHCKGTTLLPKGKTGRRCTGSLRSGTALLSESRVLLVEDVVNNHLTSTRVSIRSGDRGGDQGTSFVVRRRDSDPSPGGHGGKWGRKEGEKSRFRKGTHVHLHSSHRHTRSHPLTLTPTPTHPRSHASTLTALTHTHTATDTHTHTFTPTLTPTIALKHTLTYTYSHTHTVYTHTLHRDTHTHTHSHRHTSLPTPVYLPGNTFLSVDPDLRCF